MRSRLFDRCVVEFGSVFGRARLDVATLSRTVNYGGDRKL